MKTAKGFPGETFALANTNLSSLDNFLPSWLLFADYSHVTMLLLLFGYLYPDNIFGTVQGCYLK